MKTTPPPYFQVCLCCDEEFCSGACVLTDYSQHQRKEAGQMAGGKVARRAGGRRRGRGGRLKRGGRK